VYERDVRPALAADDEGKFVALDLDSGEYELDADDYSAVARLQARLPAADIWLGRVGQPAAHRMRQIR